MSTGPSSLAQDIVGAASPQDYLIRPTEHATQLQVRAPAFAALLQKSELSVVAAEYERKDAEANRNQLTFRANAARANWAVFVTAGVSSLLLLTSALKPLSPHVFGTPMSALFGSCGVISGALAAMWLSRVREGQLLHRWKTARAAAESLRTQYFETVTSLAPPEDSSAIPMPLLQFEYFRRYQLDVQLAFFDKRSQDCRREADGMLQLSAASVATSSLSTGLAAFLALLHPAFISVAAIASVAAALASFASTNEAVSQSRGNSERYAQARDAIALLKEKLDEVREAAAGGARDPVKLFVAAVHQQLSLEHRQWLDAAQNIQPALDQLDAALAKLKSSPADPLAPQ